MQPLGAPKPGRPRGSALAGLGGLGCNETSNFVASRPCSLLPPGLAGSSEEIQRLPDFLPTPEPRMEPAGSRRPLRSRQSTWSWPAAGLSRPGASSGPRSKEPRRHTLPQALEPKENYSPQPLQPSTPPPRVQASVSPSSLEFPGQGPCSAMQRSSPSKHAPNLFLEAPVPSG